MLSWPLCIISYRRTSPGPGVQFSKPRLKSHRGYFSQQEEEEGVVPLEWKEANIIPLFKKGSRSKSENYRPVSLTSVVCKLLERLIKDHLVDFLVKNNLINPSQHGFLKARSCLTNILCFLEDVTKWVDE